ncbi:hypothetical protein [Trinickia fusca]|nr:hypothetical protein [Trinickia fusca]
MNLQFLSGISFIPWDSFDEFFPQVKFVVSAIRAGQAPWWNPFMYGGAPVLGDPQGMIFTPHTLIGVLSGSHFGLHLFDVTTLAMELLGGLALVRYARRYSGNWLTPILGALVFMVGGVATSRLEHVPQIVSYGLLPLQLLTLRVVCLRPSVFSVLAFAGALAAGALNPNQVVFLSAFALIPFVAFHLNEARQRGRAIIALAVAGALALLVDAPALSAIVEFVKFSNRAALGLQASSGSSLPFFDLSSLYLPGLFGVHGPQSGVWAPTDLSEDYLYIGLVPALVLITATFQRRRISGMASLCLCSAVFWFVFAMGTNTPVYGAMFNHLPGFSAFRRPADGAYFLNLFVALLIAISPKFERARMPQGMARFAIVSLWLVALGVPLALLVRYAQAQGHFNDLLIVFHSFGRRLGVVAAVLVAVQWCRRVDSRRWMAPALIGLTIVDIATVGRIVSPFAPHVRGSELAMMYANREAAAGRDGALSQTIAFLRDHGVAGTNPSFRMEALGGPLGASMPIAYRVFSTQGYSPISLSSYNHVIGAENLQSSPKQFTTLSPNYDSSAYRRLGVRYVLLYRPTLDHSGGSDAMGSEIKRIRAELSGSTWAHVLDAPGAYEIWELGNPLARAMAIAPDGTESACEVTSFEMTSVSVRCHSPQARRIVLGDVHAPGWKACVNGEPVETEPYEGLFRSAIVPNGDIAVTFRYQPVPFLRQRVCG